MINDLYSAYKVLESIISEGAYSSIALSKDKNGNHKLITKIVYGVLDNYIKYDYFINQLSNNRPKKKIRLVIMIGLYCLQHMDSMPDYAVVNNSVELTKKVGKKQIAGFVNVVLKKAINFEYEFPVEEIEKLSVQYSKPNFLVKDYIDNYGISEAKILLSIKPFELEHIRHNSTKINKMQLIKMLDNNNIDNIESKAGGLFIRNNDFIYELFNQGLITFQSLTSMICVQSMELLDNTSILDSCSAPGGKTVYMAEIAPNSNIVACDIHNNRLKLVKSYISRMGINNISVILNDATVDNKDFYNTYDYVLCDVPCSGMGLINKKPDIAINKTEKDIEKLNEIQYNIIINAGNYVKKGGILLYSTCSTMKSENQDIVNKFLAKNNDYKLDSTSILDNQGHKTFLPDNFGQDGFYIARLRRI